MTRVIITAAGAGSVVAPAGTYQVLVEAWGGGGGGGGAMSSYANGGGGGGYAKATCPISGGSTLFWNVGAVKTGTIGAGANGNNSWLNVSANSQPAVIANGVFAVGGTADDTTTPPPGGGFGPSGASGFTGGTAGISVGGGGGGAGSAGNGSNGGSSSGGAGGTPDGGAGGNSNYGGAGAPGVQPGGGGGGGGGSGAGKGAAGQIAYTFYIASVLVLQWMGQSDVRPPPPKTGMADLAAPIGVIASATPTTFVSQWLGQSDTPRLPPNRRIDDLALPPGAPKGEFLPNDVGQWLGQSDTSRLPPPKPPDSASLSIAPPPPPTPPTPSIFWMEESGLGRWTLLKPPTMWDQSASYVAPVTPPVPPIVTMTCIYSLTPNFTAPQMMRAISRYAKLGDTLTWAVSFYVNRSIVLTPIAANVTISYQTNAGPATAVLPLSATGYQRFAAWTVPANAIEVSIATWTIYKGADVAARGAINIFGRFARPLLN